MINITRNKLFLIGKIICIDDEAWWKNLKIKQTSITMAISIISINDNNVYKCDK